MPKLNVVDAVISAINSEAESRSGRIFAVKSVRIERVVRVNHRLSFTAFLQMASGEVRMAFAFTDDGVICNVFERYEDDLLFGHMDQIIHQGHYDTATVQSITSDALWYCG